MNTITPPLTYEHLADIIAALPSPVLPFHIYYTPFAIKEETVTRTWKERLFTLPWQPRQKDKLQKQPAIYNANIPGLLPNHPPRRVTIAHPAFKDAIEKALPADRGLKGQSQ